MVAAPPSPPRRIMLPGGSMTVGVIPFDVRACVVSPAVRTALGRGDWPEPVDLGRMEYRQLLSRHVARSSLLGDSQVLDECRSVLGARYWRDLATLLVANPCLPTDERVRLSNMINDYWRLRVATSFDDVPDDVVCGWLAGTSWSTALVRQVDLLVTSRPALPAHVLQWSPAARMALLWTVHAGIPQASALVADISTRSSLGRATLRAAAVNPTLDATVRQAARDRLTRSWPATRREGFQVATETPGVAWPWTPSDPDVVGSAGYLALWAAGMSLGTTDADRPVSESGIRVLLEVPQVAPALRMLMTDRPAGSLLATLAPSDVLGGLPAGSRATGCDRVLVEAGDRALLRETSWLRSEWTQAARLAAAVWRAELGDDAAAWEVLLGLAPEWSGSVTGLASTARQLAS